MRSCLHGGLGLVLAVGALLPVAACGDNITLDVGIEVTPMAVSTSEAGGRSTFTVSLLSQPTADVTIALSVDDATEGELDQAMITFTPDDFQQVPVSVTGLDDTEDDGDVAFHVVTARAASSDGRYDGLDAPDVTVTNTDDDDGGTPAIVVTANPGLVTTEAGGTATFTVVLATQPTASVSIDVASDDATEGTAAPTTLTFTTDDWDQAQTVTVTGEDDNLDDGDVAYNIVLAAAVSDDPGYSGIDPTDVPVTNSDDDSVAITVSPLAISTTEAGGVGAFTIVLGSQPTADVSIALASSDLGEGTIDVAMVTFTVDNWDEPQAVTVTGVDDPLDDGDVGYQIITAPAVSADPAFSGANAADVTVTNLDDDAPGITVSPAAGLVTTELGGDDAFELVLDSEPTGDVTIAISSSNAAEGTVAPASVTFTPGNWDQPVTVTVTGADDLVDDGDQDYAIVLAPAVSTDPSYAGLDATDVTATNLDNEAAGFIVTPANNLVTNEDGLPATFTIVLTSMPTANVAIDLDSNDPSEATVSPASLTFTPLDWSVPQVVTVTGVDDANRDGPREFVIVTRPAVSADPAYDGQNPINVQGMNFDNEPPTMNIPVAGPLVVSENGTVDRFRVRLTQPPTAPVVCTFTTDDLTEGTVSPAIISFTVSNWSVYQQITVRGIDDALDDGDQNFLIVTEPCTSADPQYNGLDPRDLAGVNQDND